MRDSAGQQLLVSSIRGTAELDAYVQSKRFDVTARQTHQLSREVERKVEDLRRAIITAVPPVPDKLSEFAVEEFFHPDIWGKALLDTVISTAALPNRAKPSQTNIRRTLQWFAGEKGEEREEEILAGARGVWQRSLATTMAAQKRRDATKASTTGLHFSLSTSTSRSSTIFWRHPIQTRNSCAPQAATCWNS